MLKVLKRKKNIRGLAGFKLMKMSYTIHNIFLGLLSCREGRYFDKITLFF